MFSGGDYDEVTRWLRNFVSAHAKRESLRAEGVVAAVEPRYGVRVRLGEALYPPADQAPLALSYDEVARHRGQLAWCAALAERIRALVRESARATPAERRLPA
jgi:hypothetical protein